MWPEEFDDRPAHIAMWREGGLNTLVKVLPADREPDPGMRMGLCTMIGHLADRTTLEIQSLIGMYDNVNLSSGAVIYLVRPLPGETQFVAVSLGTRPEDLPPLPPPEPVIHLDDPGEDQGPDGEADADDADAAARDGAAGESGASRPQVDTAAGIPDEPRLQRTSNIPRWNVTGLTQQGLRPIARIGPAMPFFYDARLLAAIV